MIFIQQNKCCPLEPIKHFNHSQIMKYENYRQMNYCYTNTVTTLSIINEFKIIDALAQAILDY